MNICCIDGCTNQCHQGPKRQFKYCFGHLNERRRRKSKTLAATNTPPSQVNGIRRILLVNLHTSRAQAYDVLLATPVRAVVPVEPEAYARFVRQAQDAGYVVCLEG